MLCLLQRKTFGLITYTNLLRAKAKPDPILRYFSNLAAFVLSLNPQYQISSKGALLEVYLTILSL